MYLPTHFAESDLAALDALAAAHPFATLITLADGSPFVSHLPVLYRRDGGGVELRGHWSRANPQWKHGGEATLILHGPDAYVSPSWYPDKGAEARVPTWNYAVAHLAGALEILQDEADLAAIVADLAVRFEGEVRANDPAHVAWEFDIGNPAERVQLKGIVGFRMRPANMVLKFKLNQNHPVANVDAVVHHLANGDEKQRAVSALMKSANATRTLSGPSAQPTGVRRDASQWLASSPSSPPSPLPVGEGKSTTQE